MIVERRGEGSELAPFCGSGRGGIKLAYGTDGTLFFLLIFLIKNFIELSKNIHTVVVCEGGWWFLKGVDGS